MPELTPKQARFVDAYMIDLNATKAAVAAGSTAKRADQAGYEYMSNPEISAEIERRRAKLAAKHEITAERVLSEIANMAFYDIADAMVPIGENDAEGGSGVRVSDDGKLYGLRGPTDIRALPENVRRVVIGWSWDKSGNFTVKLADKSKALDQLARHLSLYNDKIELTGLGALAERMERAGKRNDP